MASPRLESRMTELEDLLAEVLRAQERTQRQVDQTSREMREFKDEMREFKDEMREFKDEMRVFKDEMGRFKDEVGKRWGELSNRMGTLAEDFIAPSVPGILRTVAGYPEDTPVSSAVRVRRTHPEDRGRSREYDVVAACGEHVLIVETRTRLRPGDIDDFLGAILDVPAMLPETCGKKLLGALASLDPDPAVVRQGERAGLLILGVTGGVVGTRNAPGFVPREL